jgi:pheromone alpha factor receptor
MPNTTNTTFPPNWDPFNQEFTLLLPDGTPIEVNTSDLEFLRSFGIRLAINWGSQVGASIMLLAVLLILTRSEKMCSWIFIMNMLCLLTNVIRSFLQCLYLTSNWFNPYAFLSGDFSKVTTEDKATTIASNVLTLLLVVFIFMSLSTQVWIVCVTTPKLQRLVIMCSTTLVALVAIGFRMAVVIISNTRTLKYESIPDKHNLVSQMYISQAFAIWVFCVVFTFKLGYALLQRKRLGMTQFGPMQIIFIMGCQTMVIPG